MADQTEAEVVADLAREAQRATIVEPGKRYVWVKADGSLKELDLSDSVPAFKTGTVVVKDIASFVEYYERHSDEDSEVFCDLDAGSVTAVLDAHRSVAHDEYVARWQKHRLVLQLQKTQPWVTWTEQDRKPLSQLQFADFLEDNRADLDPEGHVKAADFIEIAQHFHATVTHTFGNVNRLDNGDMEFTYKENTTEARGGNPRNTTFDIPKEFTLRIKPFDDGEAELISARFRYRATPQGVVFLYVLDNPDRHVQEAVKEIVGRLSAELDGKTIMRGTPA